MPLLARHFAKTQSPVGVPEKKEMQRGFILLEALIAMSLIPFSLEQSAAIC
jgi:type II secretory pathway component PulJ